MGSEVENCYFICMVGKGDFFFFFNYLMVTLFAIVLDKPTKLYIVEERSTPNN